ncbi:MAG: MerR family transcriptional regulator [Bacteroidia bacterium]|nr:MerR family transcriptional regulator [Bacteroidia bacterium]MBT8277039.1 MerR family transcriptional regulator [Bacteroidia bacterium]NNF31924.1 MerR family transcriptional regulator [Flavobacteriaceae bacterium]NNJ81693.1 MerR family transcriptional regulator [Flavobacteriaceae bacterium]NNK53612.1 MerR family transcriptional regulator [Flavobacteriaceae bacterium]
MSVKTQFSIKDLENLSNVKAHTIRIWEKRYNLLEPNRTETNIRQYDLLNLKKLLNVTFLYNEGLKISKIARLSESEINKLVLGHGKEKKEEFALNSFKSAMLDFDSELFLKTFDSLAEDKSFREIFFEIFLPLLNEIGILWQTGTIDPSHERFISELIKQQIVLNTERVQRKKVRHTDFVFSLYLPYEEIHEIGLLYANYEILNAGYKTIYLGINIPLDSLKFVTRHHKNVKFISYFTVKPDSQSMYDYTREFNEKIGSDRKYELWLMGYKTSELQGLKLEKNFTIFPSLASLIEKLETLKKS